MSLNKKGGIELSMTTIVIIVISVIVLIFGIIFARSVMCSGIQLTEQVNNAVKSQLTSLFGADNYGVNCEGEGSQEVQIGTGGRREVICVIKTEDDEQYDLKVADVQSLSGASDSAVNKWVIDQDWSGDVSPGGDGKEAVVMTLNIPRDAPATTLKLKIQATSGSGSVDTHYSVIDVVPAGFFTTTMCGV